MTATILDAIIIWSIQAAAKAVHFAHDTNDDLESDITVSVWNAFQVMWSMEDFTSSDYDLAVTAMRSSYREAVKALLAASRPPDSGIVVVIRHDTR